MEQNKIITMKKLNKILYIIFLSLSFRAIKAAFKLDENIKREFLKIENRIIRVGNDSGRRAIYISQNKLHILRDKKARQQSPSTDIVFKGLSSGLGAIIKEGIVQAFCRDKLIIKGDLNGGIIFMTSLMAAQNYLFPKTVTKRKPPRNFQKRIGALRFFLSVITGI